MRALTLALALSLLGGCSLYSDDDEPAAPDAAALVDATFDAGVDATLECTVPIECSDEPCIDITGAVNGCCCPD